MMYEQLLNLDPVKINFDKAGMDLLNIALAVVMYGVALGIKPGTFIKVFRHPKSILVGLIGQWIILPALTFLLILIFHKYITPMVAMGMILVASCPGGNVSNFITSISKGNRELSVSMSAVTTTAAVVTTPTNFAVWGSLYVRYLERHAADALQTLTIPMWDIFVTVFILLGIPLALGILTTHYLPRVANALNKPLQYLSIVVFLLMVILAFRQNFDLFMQYIKWILLVVFIHNGLILTTGYFLGELCRLPRPDRRAITIEMGIQNSGLGLILLFNPNIFPPELQNGGMLFVTAWWGIWHIISGLTVATIFRHRSRKRGE
jgi:BASS family bile acid:Na+ symporter